MRTISAYGDPRMEFSSQEMAVIPFAPRLGRGGKRYEGRGGKEVGRERCENCGQEYIYIFGHAGKHPVRKFISIGEAAPLHVHGRVGRWG